jgi:hypothetical protein
MQQHSHIQEFNDAGYQVLGTVKSKAAMGLFWKFAVLGSFHVSTV